MSILIAVICVFTIGLTAFWFSPLRPLVVHHIGLISSFKFVGKVSLTANENLPNKENQYFCVQMMGRIPTPSDNYDTDVRLEIDDITGGIFHPEKVLCIDERFRADDDAAFSFQVHNGCVPKKDAILSNWVTVAEIPCHVLRFAYRGRRKLLCKLSVLSTETGEILTDDHQVVEYVYCAEGYRQIQDRKLDVLKASLQLSMVTVQQAAEDEQMCSLYVQWLRQMGQNFAPATQLEHSLEAFCQEVQSLTIEQIAEPLLAFGDQNERWAAFELILQTLAAVKDITSERAQILVYIANVLEIKSERFLTACQRYLLIQDIRIENPCFLLGVDPTMDPQSFRAQLNEEYRKWNSRVTHPDREIRRQADIVLTLIAELRSRSVRQTCN